MREQIQRLSGLRVDATGIGDQVSSTSNMLSFCILGPYIPCTGEQMIVSSIRSFVCIEENQATEVYSYSRMINLNLDLSHTLP